MGNSATDIDPVPESKAFKKDLDPESLVDFEIAFFMLILTSVLAYPDDQSVLYQILKLLMVVFAFLTVLRRIIVMRDESEKYSRFMTASLAIMVEISILGVLYLVVQLSNLFALHLYFQSLTWFFILCCLSSIATLLTLFFYDREEFGLFRVVVASWEANTAETSLWRKLHRNLAVKHAKNLDIPDEELPDEVIQLRDKNPIRILPPFHGEMHQFLHGVLLTVLRRPISVFWGWMIFGSFITSLMIYFAAFLVGPVVNMLYKRFGAGEFYRRIGGRKRILLQNLTILYVHFLVLA